MQGRLDGKKKWMKEEKKKRKNERMKERKEKRTGKSRRKKRGKKKKNGCPLRPPQATSINTPAGCITNIDAISCYGQKHTLRRLACFQWLQVGVEGNQVEGRKEEGIKGEKES